MYKNLNIENCHVKCNINNKEAAGYVSLVTVIAILAL